MVRRSAEGVARIAVFGAGTVAGTRLRAELASRGVAGGRVALYGARPGESVVSEYDGEARLLQEPDVDEIAGHDIVFVCEPGAAASTLVSRAETAGRIVDLTGTLGAAPAHDPLRPPAATGPIGVPHPLAIVLAELSAPLRALGARRVVATILAPAAEAGAEGLEELREQALRLLRFESPPTKVFGRQLAFNVIPQTLIPGGAGLEERVRSEAQAVLGPDPPDLSVFIVAVPVFHGHAISLLVDGPRMGADDVRTALGEAGIFVTRGRAAATPMDASETRRTDVSLIDADGTGAIRIWAVAAEAASASARQALALAARRAAL